MIEIICGEKGKGKTKELLAKVNDSVSTTTGNVVYLDKSQKHMYELNNKVRLINVMDYPITNCDEFLGFICGIVLLHANVSCGALSIRHFGRHINWRFYGYIELLSIVKILLPLRPFLNP